MELLWKSNQSSLTRERPSSTTLTTILAMPGSKMMDALSFAMTTARSTCSIPVVNTRASRSVTQERNSSPSTLWQHSVVNLWKVPVDQLQLKVNPVEPARVVSSWPATVEDWECSWRVTWIRRSHMCALRRLMIWFHLRCAMIIQLARWSIRILTFTRSRRWH